LIQAAQKLLLALQCVRQQPVFIEIPKYWRQGLVMSEVTAASRRLLLVDPCEACEGLLPQLRSSGWWVASCDLESVGAQHFDIGLLCLSTEHLQQPLRIGQLIGRHGEWIALLGTAERSTTAEVDDFVGEWFFECHRQPFDPARLQQSLARAIAAIDLRALENCSPLAHELLGQSRLVRDLRKRLGKLGASEAPVLIRGESGSGKSLVAHDLHQHSRRAGGPFVRVDCAAGKRDELAAALFGTAQVPGKLSEASGGSLFLADVGDLPLDLQDELFMRLHGKGPQSDVRLLASSRTDLQPAVEQRRFNRRLYVWLSRKQLMIEPLRKRQGDIALLADYYLARYGSASGHRPKKLGEEVLMAMRRHHWPGNVRELANRVRRGFVSAEGEQIGAEDLGLESAAPAIGLLGTLDDYKRRAEYQALCDALARYGNNLSLAARILGISRPTFYRLLHKHQLL
jgi:DNA-binding NtrC family response regulator